MAISGTDRQITMRASEPVTKWVRPDPEWPIKHHRSNQEKGTRSDREYRDLLESRKKAEEEVESISWEETWQAIRECRSQSKIDKEQEDSTDSIMRRPLQP